MGLHHVQTHQWCAMVLVFLVLNIFVLNSGPYFFPVCNKSFQFNFSSEDFSHFPGRRNMKILQVLIKHGKIRQHASKNLTEHPSYAENLWKKA